MISDDEDENNDDEDAMVETAVAALIDLRNYNSKDKASSSSSANTTTPNNKLGKSRFSREISQQVSGNHEPVLHIINDQTAANVDDDTSNDATTNNNNNAMLVIIDQEPMKQKMFTEEELKGILNVLKVEEDLVEVHCGCTSKKYGDFVGNLTIHRDGKLTINCKCLPDNGCDLIENATPEQFASHAKGKGGPSQWPKSIWVHNVQGVKTEIQETLFFRYFQDAGLKVEKRQRLKFHRDEFLKCSQCGTDRRFKQQNTDECRAYHDAALMKSTWTCSMHPFIKMDCSSEAERASRMLVRGCRRLGTCPGCTSCVCCGCTMCRFSDCGCRICKDFSGNS
ncbi:hypothetical protein QQ045_008184 [Rhodiola kirilowii]